MQVYAGLLERLSLVIGVCADWTHGSQDECMHQRANRAQQQDFLFEAGFRTQLLTAAPGVTVAGVDQVTEHYCYHYYVYYLYSAY